MKLLDSLEKEGEEEKEVEVEEVGQRNTLRKRKMI